MWRKKLPRPNLSSTTFRPALCNTYSILHPQKARLTHSLHPCALSIAPFLFSLSQRFFFFSHFFLWRAQKLTDWLCHLQRATEKTMENRDCMVFSMGFSHMHSCIHGGERHASEKWGAFTACCSQHHTVTKCTGFGSNKKKLFLFIHCRMKEYRNKLKTEKK